QRGAAAAVQGVAVEAGEDRPGGGGGGGGRAAARVGRGVGRVGGHGGAAPPRRWNADRVRGVHRPVGADAAADVPRRRPGGRASPGGGGATSGGGRRRDGPGRVGRAGAAGGGAGTAGAGSRRR